MRHLVIFVSLCVLPLLSSCSVIMAASPSNEPSTDLFRSGTTRAAIEEEIGKPLSSHRERADYVCTYQYFTGDDHSYGRAAAYVVFDVLTVGIAEIFTTPVEALQGDKHVLTITYDVNERVKRVNEATTKAPLLKPEKMLGLEKNTVGDDNMQKTNAGQRALPPIS
jgi:hypothetical protein